MKGVLIIIPAYNEAENLPKVFDDLKKNNNFADVIFVNDCSKDNTSEVLKNSGFNYVENIFNVGYAMSVQTGIKYAVKNGYNYVIQMDADGQHIVSEAKKLYECIKENKCDIVIGSRYLRKTSYKCPATRRFGTKIFELIIKIFCRKKITDPLSGFQCLNRRVMEKYSVSSFYPEYPDANLIMEMLFLGYKIKEVSVQMRSREFGESMHGGILKPFKYMVSMFYSIALVLLQNIRRSKHE